MKIKKAVSLLVSTILTVTAMSNMVFGADDYYNMVLEHNKEFYSKERTDQSALSFLKETYTSHGTMWKTRAESGMTVTYFPDVYEDKDGDIAKLSAEITKGLSTDYDKCKAIHDWVCKNIWYDRDAYNAMKTDDEKASFINTEPTEVLKTKKTICDGYSNLTVALLREAGISAKKVSGYALGLDAPDTWTKELAGNIISQNTQYDKTINHAWTEAFIDGKWIFIDTTWDSQNKYENGRFGTQKAVAYDYFNPTLEDFSKDHKAMKNRDNLIPPAEIYNMTQQEQQNKFEEESKETDPMSIMRPRP